MVTRTQYRTEQRQREITVNRRVPQTCDVTRTYTVNVPETRQREETYTVMVPQTKQREQQYTVVRCETRQRENRRIARNWQRKNPSNSREVCGTMRCGHEACVRLEGRIAAQDRRNPPHWNLTGGSNDWQASWPRKIGREQEHAAASPQLRRSGRPW